MDRQTTWQTDDIAEWLVELLLASSKARLKMHISKHFLRHFSAIANVLLFQIRIWSQPDTYDQTQYALQFAEKAYDFFAEYFNTPEVVPKAGEHFLSSKQAFARNILFCLCGISEGWEENANAVKDYFWLREKPLVLCGDIKRRRWSRCYLKEKSLPC